MGFGNIFLILILIVVIAGIYMFYTDRKTSAKSDESNVQNVPPGYISESLPPEAPPIESSPQ
jgi:flagellar basal body-associated protein FliL